MSLQVYINTDTQDLPLNTSAVDWIEFVEGSDQIIFTAGNSTVADGESVPSQAELTGSGVELTGSQIVVDTYLMQDTGSNLLRSINGMGNLDKRYVLAFSFSSETASEPVLEVWDDDNMNSATGTMLGGGTPSQSFIRGVTTTDASPGTDWITGATRMAGGGDGNFLFLNNQAGALASAKILYANLAVVIPSSQTTGFSANVVFVAKWLQN